MRPAQGQPETKYSITATSYAIRLTRDTSDVGPVIIAATTQDGAKTPGWGDVESIPLSASTPAAGMDVYQSPYPLNGLATAATSKNGTLESNAGGLITLTWTYARDSRETVTYTLSGNLMPVTLPPTATPTPDKKTFTNLDPAFTVALKPGETGATIHYTVDGKTPDSTSPVYTSPITISKTTTLKAMDTKTNQLPSVVVQFTYTQTIAPNPPSNVFVQFPNGKSTPDQNSVPPPGTTSQVVFIPIDKSGVAIPGGADGKCPGNCFVGGYSPGTPFVGPIINLEIPGPVEYEFKIFTNLGDFVVSGSGKYKVADLPLMELTPDGKKWRARIIWTGNTANGSRAGNGAYILRCTIKTLNENPSLVIPITNQSNSIVFGMIRQGHL